MKPSGGHNNRTTAFSPRVRRHLRSCGPSRAFGRRKKGCVSPSIATRGTSDRAAKADDEHHTNRSAGQPLGAHTKRRCHTQTARQLDAVDASLARRSRHAQLDLQPTGRPARFLGASRHMAGSRRYATLLLLPAASIHRNALRQDALPAVGGGHVLPAQSRRPLPGLPESSFSTKAEHVLGLRPPAKNGKILHDHVRRRARAREGAARMLRPVLQVVGLRLRGVRGDALQLPRLLPGTPARRRVSLRRLPRGVDAPREAGRRLPNLKNQPNIWGDFTEE